MFRIVEFDDHDGGGVAIANSKWFTPRKRELYWLPYKEISAYNKALKKGEDVNTDWKLFKIKILFYETAEQSSDLNTDCEDFQSTRRIIRKPRTIVERSDDEESSKFERPPRVLNIVKNKSIGKSPQSQDSQNILDSPSCSQSSVSQSTSVLADVAGSSSFNVTDRIHINSPSTTIVGDVRSFLPLPQIETTFALNPDNTEHSALQKKILHKLLVIEEQNKQIIQLLLENKKSSRCEVTVYKPNLPVALPLININSIIEIENFLSNEENFTALSSYLASLGGKHVPARTNRILREILTDEVSSLYNFHGLRNEK
ncbi:hypothetical protein FQR65_LT12738 [Abscondita terminalis]|nr:hypothetical protein FQR65_LT12738 [Abscondita terminalis]